MMGKIGIWVVLIIFSQIGLCTYYVWFLIKVFKYRIKEMLHKQLVVGKFAESKNG